ncbi:MAG: PIN domain-containing protein [Anaerolineae bacterium]|nr:PIN domain-containing protein [Anaerolineae bacterium]
MPQLVLDYSGNVGQEVNFQRLFLALHRVLADEAGIDMAACKSRAVCRDAFAVGEGGVGQAFVHLEVGLLSGRAPEQKRDIAAACLDVLALHYAESLESLDLQITVEVRDMDRQGYVKKAGGQAQAPSVAASAVVIDTNSFVAAAFNPGSNSARVIEAVRAERLRLVWNDATRREVEYVVGKIPPISFQPFAGLFRPEDRYAGDTHPERYSYVPDPDDRKFLALAQAAGATLITQDDHLLAGRERATVPVLRPGEFLERWVK